MAKAIYGHTGTDPRLAGEIARLRTRVRDLEAEVSRLQAAVDAGPDAIPGAWTSDDWALPDDLLVPDPR